jgi:ParB family transcriptional regulator, chromosome partitioning protein
MTAPHAVRMIPVEQITVLNPRERNKRLFGDIVTNIAHLGLKRPITVTPRRREGDGAERYDLVCGQGRLEAYRVLGETEIPALVIDASEEDCMVMSLVENIARRQHRQIELVEEIGHLRARGYSEAEIARKTDLDAKYVRGILRLLEHGEERLIAAVEQGRVPISVAAEIAGTDDEGARHALRDAYESGQLRGDRLAAARRLVDQRNRSGRRFSYHPGRGTRLTAESLVRVFRQEADRQRLLVKRAELARNRLLFIVSALRTLLADEHFVTLLRAEALHSMPRYLADRINATAPRAS